MMYNQGYRPQPQQQGTQYGQNWYAPAPKAAQPAQAVHGPREAAGAAAGKTALRGGQSLAKSAA